MLRRTAGITRVPVTVTLNNASVDENAPVLVTLILQSKQAGKSITKTVHFVVPKKN
jgi:hypothetical protein